ncbi:hypothetical protein CASFOL_005226 [Castilleja foliolosa]|uniref:Uncharacterized protein n=1 Tax=Castilleja foliolosa TaxID=1961234 RepID=A0ABD3E2V0_9LAMI
MVVCGASAGGSRRRWFRLFETKTPIKKCHIIIQGEGESIITKIRELAPKFLWL